MPLRQTNDLSHQFQSVFALRAPAAQTHPLFRQPKQPDTSRSRTVSSPASRTGSRPSAPIGRSPSFPCVARIGIGSCVQAIVAALYTTCCAYGSKRTPYRSVSLSGTSRTWILRATDDRIWKPTVSNAIDSSHGSKFQPRILAMCAREMHSACWLVPRHGRRRCLS